MPRSGLAVRDSGTILGFDFGEKRIGVAVGDVEVGLAHPLRLIAAETNDQRFAQIAVLIQEWQPVMFAIWCRDASLAEFPLTWQEALDFVATMNREQRFGQRDWRMPNRRELRSLLSLQNKLPALPERHPFINVFHGWYWTATTAAISPAHAWYVALDGARMFYGGKDQSFMLWPVRGEGLNVIPRTGQSIATTPQGKPLHAPVPVRTVNSVMAPRGLNHASKFFKPAYWIVSPACSGAAARTSHRNRWSGARHWQQWPG